VARTFGANMAHTVIEPTTLSGLRPTELWRFRELLYFLTWRDIKVRYKQTVLGIAWAVLQPLLTMVVFTIFFGNLGRMQSDGLPYPLFTYTALLPWQLFAHALNESGNSVVASQNLITKAYFPRLVIPLAPVLAGLVDFVIASGILLILMAVYGVLPTASVIALPLFVAVALLAAVGAGLWLSALNVEYRDVRYTIPFLTQFWLFVTPVIYPLTIVPERWRLLYSLNPMVGVVEGFRWALLGKPLATPAALAVSTFAAAAMFVSGAIYFRRREDAFADSV
jgi:lipopolysaccharide transport system permease protein